MGGRRAPYLGRTEELLSLCKSITDCHHSTPLYLDEGKLVIRNYNIKNGRLILDKLSYTDDKHFKQRTSRAEPEPEDLIITREAPMGEVCIIPQGVECCLGQRMVLIKPNTDKVNNKFLLYALLSEFVQKQINKSSGTGSIVSNLRIPVLKGLKIQRFEIDEQKKIGIILSHLDAKIELNNKINTELEAMAKLIYDYWFVQFDFPDENGKPYKSSGGKMVYNEELKREIPEGWEVHLIETCFDYLEGPGIRKFNYSENGHNFINIRCIQNGDLDISNASKIKKELVKDLKHFLLEANDVVVSTSGSLGRSAVIRNEHLPLLLNTSVIRFRPLKPHYYSYMVIYLKSQYFIGKLKQLATGSIQKNFGPTHLKQIKDTIPPDSIFSEFEKLIAPILTKQIINKSENQKLSELRDWLLPMLMNGQVTVK